ncbi:rhodanese-like domain-containing protein [Helicobacter cinaedi]|uniref:rhodanese-like domain-containing protein n=1 Tax=Helicobacter cinaedi TaxID=213 RepID=UPI002D777132|nr:rhodanese-like domain-containing protein [Helicobacter cinaedi]
MVSLGIESFVKRCDEFAIIDTRNANAYNVAHLKDSINLATKDSISIFIQENFNLQDSNTTNNFNLSSPPPH